MDSSLESLILAQGGIFAGRNWEDVRGIDRKGSGSCETVVGGA